MAAILNGTATNPAADAIASGHNYAAIVFRAEGGDIVFNIDATAAVGAGEVVKADTAATINDLNGRRLSVFATAPTTYSIREAL